MRLVRDLAVLEDEIAAARREARSSFGDDTLLVERWIDRPRHIEIQVLADTHGNVIHLGERECSLQRRHQKIIEEAPSVLLTPEIRASMGAAAVEAARSCGYVGAGTVEFIVPGVDPSAYYFMEMNTRLQVEHPVTELVTGIDLVEWQLRVASGEALPFTQDDIHLTGWAIEARICAEDPSRGFLPSGGTVLSLNEPQGNGVRTDSGLSQGTEVSSLYDPMLSKVIVHAKDRPTALRKLRAALADTVTLGVPTNAGFLRRLLAHEDVVAGDLDTGLVERDAESLVPEGVPAEVYAAAAAVRLAELAPEPRDGWTDPFSVPSGWRLGGRPAPLPFPVRVPGSEPVAVEAPGGARVTDTSAMVTVDGVTHHFHRSGNWLGRDGDSWHVLDHDPVEAALSGAKHGGADTLAAPMPGTVTVVKVAVGDEVEAGQSLLVVEAMKMEHVISAPHAGDRHRARRHARLHRRHGPDPGRRRPPGGIVTATGLPMVVPDPALPTRVRIHEVGARDGLQNEKSAVPTDVKAEFIRRLAAAGLDTVEATSFVHPKWVPQLADAEELFPLVRDLPVRLPVLVPNERGLDRALALGAREIAVFASATESFAKANLNRTVDEALALFAPTVTRAIEAGLKVRGYLSMCFGDPWEGAVPVEQVVRVTKALAEMGCDELSLGDTIGVATPGHVQALLTALNEAGVPTSRIAVHFHDTYGQALSNTLAALRHGVTTVDASAAWPRRLPVREERDRQSRHRGSRVDARRSRHRDRGRSGRPHRHERVDGRAVGLTSPSRTVRALSHKE